MKRIHLAGHKLTVQILIALALGLIFGLFLKFISVPFLDQWVTGFVLSIGGDIFFSALQLLVVPVVFVSLTCGVASLTDIRQMGRIGGRTFLWYIGTTALAVAIALVVSIFVGPGKGFNLTTEASFAVNEAPSLRDVIVGFVPSNPIKAMAESNMIQIIVLSILVGLAISVAGESGKRIGSLFGDLNEVVMRLVMMVMAIAPIGVFCLIAQVFAEQGFSAIVPLSKYFFTVLGVLILHVALVYSGILKVFGRLSVRMFFRKFRQVMIFAFSTSSSNATLPVTLEVAEKDLGVKNSVASFTLPLGATINMDGTAVMQGVATVFISQAYGIDIGLVGYLTVIGMAVLASVGTAGVPGVGLVTLAMVLRQVNLPVEGIGLIIGVDRLLDMTRTMVNVTGDAVVTCVVAKGEGELDERVYNQSPS